MNIKTSMSFWLRSDKMPYIFSAYRFYTVFNSFLHKNSNVCFKMDIDQELVCSDDSCTMRYRSVIGMGKASFLEESVEKRKALDTIMRHYSKEPRANPEAALKRTTIIKVKIEAVTGKVSGY